MAITEHQKKTLQRAKGVLAATTAKAGNLAIVDLIVELEEHVDEKVEQIEQTYPKALQLVEKLKGKDGKDADEKRIVNEVLRRIPRPEDGRDADEEKIIREVLRKIPRPEDGQDAKVDYDSIIERVLGLLPERPMVSSDTAEDIRNKLELLDGEERLKRSAIEGLEDFDPAITKRAIDILDKRTEYLINKATAATFTLTTTGSSGPATYSNNVLNIPQYTGGSGVSVLVPTGAVNGVNKVFTFTSAPVVVILDNGNTMNKTSSDSTANWTGTTTITLQIAPTFNIFGF